MSPQCKFATGLVDVGDELGGGCSHNGYQLIQLVKALSLNAAGNDIDRNLNPLKPLRQPLQQSAVIDGKHIGRGDMD